MSVKRRELKFQQLTDVVRDAETLLANGYQRAGNWDLSQVSGHLADWMSFPVNGFPRQPLPIRLMLGAMRVLVGRSWLKKILETGVMFSGRPTTSETVPSAGGDESKAVERLRQTVTGFNAHQGDYHPSPLFGALTRDQALRLQLIHCAHHLSFLIPK